MKKFMYIMAAGLLTLTACQHDIERSELFVSEQDALDQLLKSERYGYHIYDENNGGLNQFVADYSTEEGNYRTAGTTEYRSRAKYNNLFLFSIDTIPAEGKGIYIKGRITTDDYAGNFYKAFVIQQIVDGKQQALRISVDAGSAGGMYEIGQEILIRVNGFAVGRYANQPQLCVPSYNNNLSANKAEEKVGWVPGRIPSAEFAKAVTFIGLPDKSKIVCDTIDLAQLQTNWSDIVGARTEDGKLVCFKNIHFTGNCNGTDGSPVACSLGDPEIDDKSGVFGPTTGNVGYPQSREIADAAGNTCSVSTSEYAKYAHMLLPDKKFVGTATGILSYYFDNGNYAPNKTKWAISLRNLQDLELEDEKGNAWVPTEWTPDVEESAEESTSK